MKRRARLILILCCLVSAAAMGLAAGQDIYREAYDVGFAEGRKAGSADREDQKPFDFASKPVYQEAVQGFDRDQQDREVYRVAFRRGFEDGYEEGYGLDETRRSSLSAPAAGPESQSVKLTGREVLTAGTNFRIRLLESLTTQRNEAGDEFRAEVVGDILVNGVVVIPSRTLVTGVITQLKRAGRIKGRSEMTLKLKEVDLAHGTRLALEASVVGIEDRETGEVDREAGTITAGGRKGKDAGKISAAAGIGALIGILSGGGKGGAVGAAVGAAAGSAGVLATRGGDLVIPVETELAVQVDRDTVVSTGLLRTATRE